MKKYKFIFIIIAFVAVIIITAVVLITRYIVIHKDDLIYQFMLYEHIEYNGNAYYAISSHERPSGEGVSSEIRGPVYLVCKSRKINYEKCNTAYVYTGYEGEEEEIYLFFDSALYIRGDYQNSKTYKTDSNNFHIGQNDIPGIDLSFSVNEYDWLIYTASRDINPTCRSFREKL